MKGENALSRQKNYKKNASYQIYINIKNRILNLEYKPNGILYEDELAKEFDISRTPIRSAIQNLKNEGFIKNESGNTIAPLSLEEYMMIYQIREHLELLSIEIATLNWTDNNIVLLEENLHKQKTLLYNKDYQPIAFLKLDRDFHGSISEIGGNFLLQKELLKYYDLYYRYNYFCGFKNRKDYAIVEHENLLTLIKTRNVNLAKAEMKDHLRNVNNQIIINLASKLNELAHK